MTTTEFSTYGALMARESVMINCVESLIGEQINEQLMELFPAIDEIALKILFLNDGDRFYPPLKVFKRKKIIYTNLAIYESEFGDRQTETDDFSRDRVLDVIANLYRSALQKAVEKTSASKEEMGDAKTKIDAFFDSFIENFRPEDSLRFGVQPPAPSEKFWLEKPKTS